MKKLCEYAVTLLVASANLPSAQPKYTITDLGTMESGADVVPEAGINSSGQVAGWTSHGGSNFYLRASRTSPNGVLSPGSGDLGTLGGEFSYGAAMNNKGQVTGYSYGTAFPQHAFRTAPNASINPVDDLGTLGGHFPTGSRLILPARWRGYPGGRQVRIGAFAPGLTNLSTPRPTTSAPWHL